MSQIISIHSFRGGTGKSNTTANISVLLAAEGQRVGVIDTDIQSPGIHVLFQLDEAGMTPALNDYLWGECRIEETAHDVTQHVQHPGTLVVDDRVPDVRRIIDAAGVWPIIHADHVRTVGVDAVEVLLDYRSAHEHSNVVTADFIAVAESIAGEDLEWFFEPWIYHEGRPSYHFS